MSDPGIPRPDGRESGQREPAVPDRSRSTARAGAAPHDDSVLCDRCGAAMFRMHAVWRCPACGYKTDCCGW
jgi:ribosomal protein L37E